MWERCSTFCATTMTPYLAEHYVAPPPRLGNVHCATNSWRSAPGLPFWEAFSIQPSQPEPRW